jgi:chromosome segregation ATPase
MKTVTLAVGISTLAVLAFMILGDSAISSRVTELEGKHDQIDATFEKVLSSQSALDGAMKESAQRIEENRLQIEKTQNQQQALSDDLTETRDTLTEQLQGQETKMRQGLDRLESGWQSLEAEQKAATDDRNDLRQKANQKLEQLRSDLEAAQTALQKARLEDQSLIDTMKKRIRDLEQQVQSSSQDRVDLVVRQGQMQKLLEDLLQTQEAMQQELEMLKSRPLP